MPIKSRTEEFTPPAGKTDAINHDPVNYWGAYPPASTTNVLSGQSYPPVSKLDETIEYENVAKKRFARCFHIKQKFFPDVHDYRQGYQAELPAPNWDHEYHWQDGRMLGEALRAYSGNSPAFSWTPDVVFQHTFGCRPSWSTYDWDGFSNRAFRAMYPSLETGFSILNFFYELKDARKSWHNLKDLSRIQFGDSPSKIYKALAGGHLNYEFAIRPFIDDVNRILDILANGGKRIKEFVQRSGRPQTRYYSESEEYQHPDLEFYIASYSRAWMRPQKANVVRSATMRYTYSVPGMDDVYSKLFGYLAQLGVNPTRPSIVWNALPFTFLVDWFFDVGDWLDNHIAIDIVPANITVIDFCVSQKFVSTISCEYESGVVQPTYTGGNGVGTVLLDVYQRERMVPSMSFSAGLETPTLKKLALATSLLVSFRG